ncbi:MAG TPA: NAD(P)/FAD-dependent oxidoreductase, partial [Candidatus Ratteibacteria bacterium]|nr:NAD(P)/FAD-dependent oxidoreductase [Candidatus Ratteibacteria bacterium]
NEIDEFISKYRNGKFLINAFSRFFNKDLIEFFEKNGLKLKVERGKRVYPASDKAEDVVKTLKKIIDKRKVKLFLKNRVQNIEKGENKFVIKTDKNIIETKKIVIATGGKSFPETGSEGDGYKWAKEFGHTIYGPFPALCGIEIKENFIKKWQGITLKNVKIKAVLNKKVIGEEFGEVLFTHYGISGPAVLNLSGDVSENISKGEIKISINLKPALNYEKLEKRLEREFFSNPNKEIKNVFKNLLPNKMIEEFLYQCGIMTEKKANQITKEERKILVSNLLSFNLNVKNTRDFSDSMVTRGGVVVNEINPKTMESKIVKGLYFAGEIIDIDGKTGGYNLQASFSTGYVAGISV